MDTENEPTLGANEADTTTDKAQQPIVSLIGGIGFLEGAPMAEISGLDPNCWEVYGCCW